MKTISYSLFPFLFTLFSLLLAGCQSVSWESVKTAAAALKAVYDWSHNEGVGDINNR